jgi:hypothetical protein
MTHAPSWSGQIFRNSGGQIFRNHQQRTLFANAPAALDPAAAPGGKTSRERELEKENAALRAKLAKKDEVIAEISAEYVEPKKEVGEP